MEYTPLQEEILKTLSYLEPMSIEFILLDMDKEFLMANPTFTTEDLSKELDFLKKNKKIKSTKANEQVYWIKIYPKRKPWYKR